MTTERTPGRDLLTGKALPRMLEMRGACGGRYGMLWELGHQMHGWIHQWNHGQWVSLRPGFVHEIERAKFLIEAQAVLDGVPCRA